MSIARYAARWLTLCLLCAAIVGSATAGFLIALDGVTSTRENHMWLIALLPLAGLATGLMYHYGGQSSAKGTSLLLQEFHRPSAPVPLRMTPLVFLGTLVTHLFGGSAGREGTAVQMGGSLADQLARPFRLPPRERQTLLLVGISAGFAAVFGTPWAGAVFALELVLWRRRIVEALPVFAVAFMADWVCQAVGAHHTLYRIASIPSPSLSSGLWTVAAAIAFGLAARLFVALTHRGAHTLSHWISYPPLRPMLGGIVLAAIVWTTGATEYIGLSIPTIRAAFDHDLPAYAFMIKLLLTAFTLAVGFKGGEATPLFFVGATLGNALVWLVPLPMDMLAGLGFIAVFAAATHTPIACAIMGLELFGFSASSAVYFLLACWVAHWVAGSQGVFGHRDQYAVVSEDAETI